MLPLSSPILLLPLASACALAVGWLLGCKLREVGPACMRDGRGCGAEKWRRHWAGGDGRRPPPPSRRCRFLPAGSRTHCTCIPCAQHSYLGPAGADVARMTAGLEPFVGLLHWHGWDVGRLSLQAVQRTTFLMHPLHGCLAWAANLGLPGRRLMAIAKLSPSPASARSFLTCIKPSSCSAHALSGAVRGQEEEVSARPSTCLRAGMGSYAGPMRRQPCPGPQPHQSPPNLTIAMLTMSRVHAGSLVGCSGWVGPLRACNSGPPWPS